jgi:hypothetical protein
MERIYWRRRIRHLVRQSIPHRRSSKNLRMLTNPLYSFIAQREIAPGRLADGSVVDVWGRSNVVYWDMPGTGAPCTSTSRPGRWRSFPYLAELEGEEADALWSYLCKQWDRENDVAQNPGRKLLRYNFFMLQADVLPNMGFSSTRKRLVHTYDCVLDHQEVIDDKEAISDEGDQKHPDSDGQSDEVETTINEEERSVEGEEKPEANTYRDTTRSASRSRRMEPSQNEL